MSSSPRFVAPSGGVARAVVRQLSAVIKFWGIDQASHAPRGGKHRSRVPVMIPMRLAKAALFGWGFALVGLLVVDTFLRTHGLLVGSAAAVFLVVMIVRAWIRFKRRL